MPILDNTKIVIVTGGRDFEGSAAKEYAHLTLNRLKPTLIVHGACRKRYELKLCGADKLADDWATENEVPCLRFPARWSQYARGAGPARNALMVRTAWLMADRSRDPEVITLVAFEGGSGTHNCVGEAARLGIHVVDLR